MRSRCRIALPLLVATLTAAVAFAAPPAPATQPRNPQQKPTADTMLASSHRYAEAVLAFPGVPDADKDKIREALQQEDAAVAKIQADQPDPDLAYQQAMPVVSRAMQLIRDRPDLWLIALRGNQIATFETSALKKLALSEGTADSYLAYTKAAGMGDAHIAKITKTLNRDGSNMRASYSVVQNPESSAASVKAATASLDRAVLTARRDVRATLTPELSEDLDWAILQSNSPGTLPANVITFSTFTAPAKAPQDGQYSLKSGGKNVSYVSKDAFATLATVTLKKGQSLGFRTGDHGLEAFAGDTTAPVPAPVAPVVFWQFEKAP